MQTIHDHFIQTAEVMQGKTLFERPGHPDISFARMRGMVEAMGGRFGIDSASGRGTCVEIDLPAAINMMGNDRPLS